MFREGMIDRETTTAAKLAPKVVSPSLEERFDIVAPHFAL